MIPKLASMLPNAAPKAKPIARSDAACNATSPAESAKSSTPKPPSTNRVDTHRRIDKKPPPDCGKLHPAPTPCGKHPTRPQRGATLHTSPSNAPKLKFP